MRGERPGKRLQPFVDTGSSPHARGTRTTARGWTGRRRFIPACAGNALALEVTAWRYSVHPRMRGERVAIRDAIQWEDGSSPHARGTLMPFDSSSSRNQFIPACAGNAYLTAPKSVAWPVHPRMRGERRSSTRQIFFPDGSSPHARGTPVYRIIDGRYPRFIPACAGNANR